jgi:hypothetical protein
MVSDEPLTVTEIALGAVGAVAAYKLTPPSMFGKTQQTKVYVSTVVIMVGFAMGTFVAALVTGDY